MNTHDNYKLPPLPTIDVMGKTTPQLWFTATEVDVLRRAAIEADRKLHDRMLAHEWIRPSLGLDEDAPYRFDFYAQEIEKLVGGEPVPKGWKLVPEIPTSKQIVHMALQIKGADADGWFRTDGDDWPEHVDAAERAYKWALSEAPQPAEPDRGEPVVLATYHAIVDESGKHIIYDTRTNQLEIYDEREDAVKASPDHLSVVPVYVTATEGPLYTAPQPLSERDIPAEPVLDKYQPCGCVICTCEDEVQCQGCGAQHCGRHPIGELSDPVYVSAEPVKVDAEASVHAKASVPSDADIDELSREWGLLSAAYPSKMMVRDFARALLARYK